MEMDLFNVLANCAGFSVPTGITHLVHLIIIIIQVVVPILLIIWGMLDFAKAVIGGDEDKVKAGQKIFIKRLIAAILVFLVVTIVQLLINAVASIGAEDAGEDAGSAWQCASDIIRGQ